MSHYITNSMTFVMLIAMLWPAHTMAQEIKDIPETTSTNEAATKKVSLFRSEDKQLVHGLGIGLVAKDWTCTLNGKKLHEDLWGNPNKKLYGLHIGYTLQQSLFCGIGYRTGIAYEWYISTDKYIEELGFKRFSEHSLHIPLHVMFNLCLSKYIRIIPYGGIGFNWAMFGKLKSGPWGLTDRFGENKITGRQYPMEIFDYNNHTPHHWNVQAEAGVALRLNRVELSFTYSWGLNNHRLYDETPSRQNKLAAKLSWILPRNVIRTKTDSI